MSTPTESKSINSNCFFCVDIQFYFCLNQYTDFNSKQNICSNSICFRLSFFTLLFCLFIYFGKSVDTNWAKASSKEKQRWSMTCQTILVYVCSWTKTKLQPVMVLRNTIWPEKLPFQMRQMPKSFPFWMQLVWKPPLFHPHHRPLLFHASATWFQLNGLQDVWQPVHSANVIHRSKKATGTLSNFWIIP